MAAQNVLCDVPAVQTLGVRAYAGGPLVLPDGEGFGSLYAVNFEPLDRTGNDITPLNEMARSVLCEWALQALQNNL